MSLVTPTLFAPAFLTAASAGLADETSLLGRFEKASLPDQFRALSDLQYLYFQHRNSGGRNGMAWIEDMRGRLISDTESEDRYREFVSFRADGSAFVEFPPSISPPPVLNFSEEWGRPEVIPLSPADRLKSSDLAYFSIGALRFMETRVDWNAIDLATADLKNKKKSPPLSVSASLDRSQFVVFDRLHHSLAVYLSGIPYILGRVNDGYPGNQGLKLAQVLTAPKQKPEPEVPLKPIIVELAFEPRADAEFPPLRTVLRRGGRNCPVVIERFDPADAHLLPADLREEMLKKLASEKDPSARPFFRALRTLDGEFHALSLSFLISESGEVRMRCDRTVKRDLESRNKIGGVGLAFLLSSLQFMKRNGYWYGSGQLLYNLIPHVADAIRRQAGFAGSGKTIVSVALDGISASEGEEFLKKAPMKFEPALSSSPAPSAALAEAVLVDGRTAG